MIEISWLRSMSPPDKKIEFRIPISPTEKFFSLVRFYNFALRRLDSPQYRDARLLVAVGDHCDLGAVRRENDADTALLRDLDPMLMEFPLEEPATRGHMAHLPPLVSKNKSALSGADPKFWPWLFDLFDIPWPAVTYRYSMDAGESLPVSPAYFNLGFVAVNAKALAVFASEIVETTRRVTAATDSRMRCQIAITIIAYRAGIDIGTLPAAYNAANDLVHFSQHGVSCCCGRLS